MIVLGVVLDNDAIFFFEGYGNFFPKKKCKLNSLKT
jgi:hypothetical protein